MIVGHNLHYMAPFGIPRPGFCMFFQPASFVFHAWGRMFEPGIGFWIPRSTFWPGDPFGVKEGSRKNVLRRNHFVMAVQGKIQDPNEFYLLYRTHVGRLLCQKPWFIIISKGFTIFQENWEGPQPVNLAIPYSPTKLPISPWAGPMGI